MNEHRPDPARIHDMFASIARRYDRANLVLSGGIHHLWRRAAVRWSGVKPGDHVLDCATGTGDLAIAFRRAAGDTGEVVGIDFVPEMIELARHKSGGIRFEVADVAALPFEDGSFDIASIAFGIRNVGDPRNGIREMARVLRPGGRLIVLEFGRPKRRGFGAAYDLYRTRVLPAIGGLITGQKHAYEYLDRSSVAFPHGEEFVSLMRDSGDFSSVEFRPLTFGIAYLYRGVKR
ncbi:MAG: bifunctional demethylmenaquinone methyltransferase/2-methoxy-6-polyprenyl-1,4-benzoquinol methylase UbiE [Thermoanaerobaculia bacterium]